MSPFWLRRTISGGCRQFLHVCAVAVVLLALVGTVRADPGDGGGDDPPVPEVNLGILGSAIALLAGGLLLIRDRFRTTYRNR